MRAAGRAAPPAGSAAAAAVSSASAAAARRRPGTASGSARQAGLLVADERPLQLPEGRVLREDLLEQPLDRRHDHGVALRVVVLAVLVGLGDEARVGALDL